MKVLLDTNVLVAAFLTSGTCHELLEHCFRHHTLITSAHLKGELRKVLRGKLRFGSNDVNEVMEVVESMTVAVEPDPLATPVCRDADDDHVLAAASTAEVDCIVTGDRDLLIIERHEGIRILDPRGFWEFEQAGGE